jgi:hypothetical protein
MQAVLWSLLKLVTRLVVVASRFEVDEYGFGEVLAQVEYVTILLEVSITMDRYSRCELRITATYQIYNHRSLGSCGVPVCQTATH